MLNKTVCPLCQTYQYDKALYRATFTEDDLNARVFGARRLPDRVHYATFMCRQCGIVRGNPVLKQYVVSDLYEHSLSTDHEQAKAAAQTYVQYLNSLFAKLDTSASILEVGCGAGYFLKLLQQQGFANIQGIEPSQMAIDASGVMKPFIRQGMFEDQEAIEQKYDLITAFHVFDHSLNPIKFLNTVKKNLNKDGYLMMVMHDIDTPLNRILGERSPMIDIEHPFLYNKTALAKLLTIQGFKILYQFNVYNTYALNYWLRLLPLDEYIKVPLINALNKIWIGRMPITMALGNQGIIAQRI